MMRIYYILEIYVILARSYWYFSSLGITRERNEARNDNELESGKNIKNHIVV